MAFDGKAVHEGDFAPGWMPGVGPVTGFEQHGVPEIDLHDFAYHTVNFYPVANPKAIAAHQNEPAHECDDEILQRNRQPCAG